MLCLLTSYSLGHTTSLSLSNLPSMDKCVSLFLLPSLSFLSKKGLKLKKIFGLLFRSCDTSFQFCFMALHLCRVASFRHFLLSSKSSGVLFWLYLLTNLRFSSYSRFPCWSHKGNIFCPDFHFLHRQMFLQNGILRMRTVGHPLKRSGHMGPVNKKTQYKKKQGGIQWATGGRVIAAL